MKCTCNAFSSELIGIFTDFTRVLGEPIPFPPPPEPVVPEKESIDDYVVVPTTANPSQVETRKSSVNTDSTSVASGSAGTNYVWMGQTIIFSLLTVTGALVTRKQDKKDEQT